MDMTPIADRAGVTYAIVGNGKALHFSPRNDETLCHREIRAYIDLAQACELGEQGMKTCRLCFRAAQKRAAEREAAITPEVEREQLAAAGAPQTIEAAIEQMRSTRYMGTRADTARTLGELYDSLDDAARAALPEQLDVVLDAISRTNNEASLVDLSKRAVELWDERPVVEAAPAEQVEDTAPAVESTTVPGTLVDPWTWIRRPATSHDTRRAAPATEQRVVEGVVVEHAGVAEGSTPADAGHPNVAAARAALDGLKAAAMTDHHDVNEPTEAEQDVRGYLIDPREGNRVAVYWLEGGRVVRRDDPWHGPALDILADRLRSRGWAVEKMLRSSQCVFAHRPAEPDGPRFEAGARVVCADGRVRTVEGMAPAIAGEPARVVVAGGAEWNAGNCSPAPALSSMAGRKLAESRCLHNQYAREDVSGDPVKACARKQPNQEAGVFNDEGCIEAYDCAVEAANRAAEWNAEEEAPTDDPLYGWDLMCPQHHEQQVDTCEECAADDEQDASEAELLDTVEAVEQAERADGTWRGAWIAATSAAAALFNLGPAAEQGALFA
ncbi:hypothetical protein PH213_16905 [Streptomyces sp. SRF1]|uniref:hypothetical protein n=1 Tax=Streptomyces sp. SRF1 TaxID=1549642 RepID=UPI0025B03544|nr:hypothetical protein [Streptomyces sp. SRF1]MDN3056195.1 hypothetical protein [Streptomyces sp. SRF1]